MTPNDEPFALSIADDGEYLTVVGHGGGNMGITGELSLPQSSLPLLIDVLTTQLAPRSAHTQSPEILSIVLDDETTQLRPTDY
jgi:hypothetical protein